MDNPTVPAESGDLNAAPPSQTAAEPAASSARVADMFNLPTSTPEPVYTPDPATPADAQPTVDGADAEPTLEEILAQMTQTEGTPPPETPDAAEAPTATVTVTPEAAAAALGLTPQDVAEYLAWKEGKAAAPETQQAAPQAAPQTFALDETEFDAAGFTSKEAAEQAIQRALSTAVNPEQVKALAQEHVKTAVADIYRNAVRAIEADMAYDALIAAHPEVEADVRSMEAFEAAIDRHNRPDVRAKEVVRLAYEEFKTAYAKAAAIRQTGKRVDVRPQGSAPSVSPAPMDARGTMTSPTAGSADAARIARAFGLGGGR